MGIGASVSTKDTPSRSGEDEVFVAEGMYGAVYRTGDGSLLKRQKTKTSMIEPHTSVWREMRAYDWIDSLDGNTMQNVFCCRRRYTVRHDQTYAWVPMELLKQEKSNSVIAREWAKGRRAEIDIMNKYPYVLDLYIEDKGRPLNMANARASPNHVVRRIFAQCVRIIAFMQNQGVIHADLHAGNVVVQPSGRIALIDYGEFFFRGDPEYKTREEEHTMMMQLSGAMIDIENNFDIEEGFSENITAIQTRVDRALQISGMTDRLADISGRAGYDDPLEKAKDPNAHDFVVSVLFNLAKVANPKEFKAMMGYPPSAVLHSFVSEADLMFVYTHLRDLDSVAAYFDGK